MRYTLVYAKMPPLTSIIIMRNVNQIVPLDLRLDVIRI